VIYINNLKERGNTMRINEIILNLEEYDRNILAKQLLKRFMQDVENSRKRLQAEKERQRRQREIERQRRISKNV
jgi:hypothetical protein